MFKLKCRLVLFEEFEELPKTKYFHDAQIRTS